MLTTKYVASLIAGAVISLGLLTVSKDLVTPATALPISDADPNVFSVFDLPAAESISAARYDDGRQLPGGAYLSEPAAAAGTVTIRRTICVQHSDGWWTRGPVRRVVSWPVRKIIGRRHGK